MPPPNGQAAADPMAAMMSRLGLPSPEETAAEAAEAAEYRRQTLAVLTAIASNTAALVALVGELRSELHQMAARLPSFPFRGNTRG